MILSENKKESYFSIFYHNSRWEQLIRQCLIPELDGCIKGKKINCFYWHLSEDQGHHIKLTVQGNQNLGFESVLKENISEYLIHYPSENLVQKFPMDSFFMNFENNAVKMAIYRPFNQQTSVFDSSELLQIRSIFTNIIASQIDGEFGDEFKVGISVYVLMTVLHTYFSDCRKMELQLREIITLMLSRKTIRETVMLERQLFPLDLAASGVPEIWQDFMENYVTSTLTWLNPLGGFLKDKQVTHQEFNSLFLDIIYLFQEQLGADLNLHPYFCTFLLYRYMISLP
ncbi:hypothetical protein SAMN05421827_101564 [Pedobacter terrae]|uniref:Thiopeptide-type bacteriocin biosynthesis domain-containing protein n=1 Tax=Pedobacter terrae TaxID=405671 RepID=A0A1G7NYR1_9SPHI|nr:lantibiotic dehydratase C-terminal domain-containing protein [Pedobacter terrae]SDF79186.1 hypothetical protein SAMN05421827_101564 [Pedobacter terrae]